MQYIALINSEGTLSIYVIGEEIREHQRFDVNVIKIVRCNHNCWLVLTDRGDLEWCYLNQKSGILYQPDINLVDIAVILQWKQDPISNVLAIDDSGLLHHYVLNLRYGPVEYRGQIILSSRATRFVTGVMNGVVLRTQDKTVSCLVLEEGQLQIVRNLNDCQLRLIDIMNGKITMSNPTELISHPDHYFVEAIRDDNRLVALDDQDQVLELSNVENPRLITSGVERLGYQLPVRTRIKSALSDN